MAIGRPRAFDADEALERAMRVFWAQGYEGASLTDLTEAMGITRTSLYAAFGNKEALFRKALERYADGPGAYAASALQEPTAREVAEALLRGAVRTTTRPECPAGCLSVQGALAVSDGSRPAHDLLMDWRTHASVLLEERFRRAVEEGDLDADTDPVELARYVRTLAVGISVQAADGLGADALQGVVDRALRDWP
jgi:AcrR family transcriptional regulator